MKTNIVVEEKKYKNSQGSRTWVYMTDEAFQKFDGFDEMKRKIFSIKAKRAISQIIMELDLLNTDEL